MIISSNALLALFSPPQELQGTPEGEIGFAQFLTELESQASLLSGQEDGERRALESVLQFLVTLFQSLTPAAPLPTSTASDSGASGLVSGLSVAGAAPGVPLTPVSARGLETSGLRHLLLQVAPEAFQSTAQSPLAVSADAHAESVASTIPVLPALSSVITDRQEHPQNLSAVLTLHPATFPQFSPSTASSQPLLSELPLPSLPTPPIVPEDSTPLPAETQFVRSITLTVARETAAPSAATAAPRTSHGSPSASVARETAVPSAATESPLPQVIPASTAEESDQPALATQPPDAAPLVVESLPLPVASAPPPAPGNTFGVVQPAQPAVSSAADVHLPDSREAAIPASRATAVPNAREAAIPETQGSAMPDVRATVIPDAREAIIPAPQEAIDVPRLHNASPAEAASPTQAAAEQRVQPAVPASPSAPPASEQVLHESARPRTPFFAAGDERLQTRSAIPQSSPPAAAAPVTATPTAVPQVAEPLASVAPILPGSTFVQEAAAERPISEPHQGTVEATPGLLPLSDGSLIAPRAGGLAPTTAAESRGTATAASRTLESVDTHQWPRPVPANTVLLHLEPPELGTLLVQVRVSEKRLIASFRTQTPEVEGLLRTYLPALHEVLHQQGFAVQPIAVSVAADGFTSHMGAGTGASTQQHSTFHAFAQEHTDVNPGNVGTEAEVNNIPPRPAARGDHLLDVLI